MKKTLSSQEYNEIFRNAQKTFDLEMAKRDIAINNISKEVEITKCINDFIQDKISNVLMSNVSNKERIITFDNDIIGNYNKFGFNVHPKFRNTPIDIFNLKLMSGASMFKNSLICKHRIYNSENSSLMTLEHIEGEKDENIKNKEIEWKEDNEYVNFIISDNSLEKKIIFDKLTDDMIQLEYTLDNTIALGTARFNVIEIEPYLYGAYTLTKVEIYNLDSEQPMVATTPKVIINKIDDIGKIRILLDEREKFSKVVFEFKINYSIIENDTVVYPFGLKHIHFYEANFLNDSYVILPIQADDYIEYIYNDIILYNAGEPIITTCEEYNIEIYSSYINNTLTNRVYTSSEAKAYRITKNTKTLYAKIPLIYEDSVSKKYLSLTGIKFNYTCDENYYFS